ncbi:MAG: calcium/proton transporter [Methylococcaceae bacterium]
MKIINGLKRNVFVLLGWLVWLVFTLTHLELGPEMGLNVMLAAALMIFIIMLGCVFAVNRHAEHLSTMLKEPFGTLILTLAVAAIEVSLMLQIMMTGDQNPSMLRDTVFASLMIMLNGMVGLSLIVGGWKHFEQTFNLRGALSYLHLIAPLSLILLVMPSHTLSSVGPTLIPAQEIFLGLLCILVYLLFLFMQTTRHKELFDQSEIFSAEPGMNEPAPTQTHNNRGVLISAAGLIMSVTPIVLLADFFGGFINYGIETLHAPIELAGLIIAALVLIPESLSAYRIALDNNLQRSVNICLGSVLSSIALTVPAIMLATGLQDLKLIIGVTGAGSTLLYASLLTALITLMTGRTTVLQGHVHLMLFFGYLFLIFYP